MTHKGITRFNTLSQKNSWPDSIREKPNTKNTGRYHIKLSSVVSDMSEATATKIIEAMINGEEDVEKLS